VEGRSSIPGKGKKCLSFPRSLHLLWALAAYYQMGTEGPFSLEVKRQGREANHSPPSSVEVK
jgi:hypothetical protein